jgi:hypothetical protein
LAVSVALEIGSKRLLAARVILSGNNLNIPVTTVEAGKTRNSMYLSTAQNTLITASK